MDTIINIIISLDLVLAGIEFLYINKQLNKLRNKVKLLEDILIDLDKGVCKAIDSTNMLHYKLSTLDDNLSLYAEELSLKIDELKNNSPELEKKPKRITKLLKSR